MNRLVKTVARTIVLLFLPVFSSCATIICGGGGNITIDSDYEGPVDITTEKNHYEEIYLPYKVYVPGSQLGGSPVVVRSDTFKEKIYVGSSFNPWLLGNLFFGGIPGLIVDLITGSHKCPDRTYYFIETRVKSPEQPKNESISSPEE